MNSVARVMSLVAVTVLVTFALGSWRAWHEMERVMQSSVVMSGSVLFRIEPGSNLSRIARDLEAHGWISHHRLFVLRAWLDGFASSIQAGTYEVSPGDTPQKMLEAFRTGDTKTFDVTFIEGIRFADMRRVLAAQPHLLHTIEDKSDEELMAELGVTEIPAEGMFFPSTYRYEAGSRDIELLARARTQLQEILNREWEERAEDLPYASPYDALIMASIIEEETGRAQERREIAGVFVRRLKRGMKLQTDPTVIYGLGKAFDGNLRRADLEGDTPYNTYTRSGLPPTPIALPGADSIAAALDPAPGKALYFVARGDGTHQFSKTLNEHNAAVRRYQLRR